MEEIIAIVGYAVFGFFLSVTAIPSMPIVFYNEWPELKDKDFLQKIGFIVWVGGLAAFPILLIIGIANYSVICALAFTVCMYWCHLIGDKEQKS